MVKKKQRKTKVRETDLNKASGGFIRSGGTQATKPPP